MEEIILKNLKIKKKELNQEQILNIQQILMIMKKKREKNLRKDKDQNHQTLMQKTVKSHEIVQKKEKLLKNNK